MSAGTGVWGGVLVTSIFGHWGGYFGERGVLGREHWLA
jgi:hypothetical protein